MNREHMKNNPLTFKLFPSESFECHPRAFFKWYKKTKFVIDDIILRQRVETFKFKGKFKVRSKL